MPAKLPGCMYAENADAVRGKTRAAGLVRAVSFRPISPQEAWKEIVNGSVYRQDRAPGESLG